MRASIADQAITGTEPVIPDDLVSLSDRRLIDIFNWYNHYYTSEDSKKWILSYLKKHHKEYIDNFLKVPDNRVPLHIGVLTKFKSYEFEQYILRRVGELIRDYSGYKKETSFNIQDKISSKIDNIIACIENELDTLYRTDYQHTFDLYSFLQAENVKSSQVERITQYYAPLLAEVLAIKDDPYLKEYYDHLKTPQKLSYVKFLTTMMEDLQRYGQNTKIVVVRRPRKKKQKSAVQLTSAVQYKKEDNEFKLKSINPSDIVGADSVFLFNTKYRTLTRLVSAGNMTIKGTTIFGFDEDLSATKTLRKPNEFLPKVLSSSKAGLKKIMDEIATKSVKATGRLNKEVIILKVTK